MGFSFHYSSLYPAPYFELYVCQPIQISYLNFRAVLVSQFLDRNYWTLLIGDVANLRRLAFENEIKIFFETARHFTKIL